VDFNYDKRQLTKNLNHDHQTTTLVLGYLEHECGLFGHPI
jgi:hypothetical protein